MGRDAPKWAGRTRRAGRGGPAATRRSGRAGRPRCVRRILSWAPIPGPSWWLGVNMVTVQTERPADQGASEEATISVLAATGLLSGAELVSVDRRWQQRYSSLLNPPEADAALLHHDLATEPSFTEVEIARLFGMGDDPAARILSWLRLRGLLLALRRPEGLVYPRFQFDPAHRCVHRVVCLVNIWLGAGTDPFTVAAWWVRPRVGDRRPCDLVGTLDEDLVLEIAAADVDRHVLTLGVQPEQPLVAPVPATSRLAPIVFLADG
jgi:hypothetical protein